MLNAKFLKTLNQCSFDSISAILCQDLLSLVISSNIASLPSDLTAFTVFDLDKLSIYSYLKDSAFKSNLAYLRTKYFDKWDS